MATVLCFFPVLSFFFWHWLKNHQTWLRELTAMPEEFNLHPLSCSFFCCQFFFFRSVLLGEVREREIEKENEKKRLREVEQIETAGAEFLRPWLVSAERPVNNLFY